MKVLTILFFLLLSFPSAAQIKYAGHYHDFFGQSIDIKSDFTFKYEWHFDMEASWSTGIWTTSNDTLYFIIIPIYDTLKFTDKSGNSLDSLVLSIDERPGQTTLTEGVFLYSGGQNRMSCPDKLFFKHDKLYGVKDGKLIKKKVKSFWIKKKFVPWFVKQ